MNHTRVRTGTPFSNALLRDLQQADGLARFGWEDFRVGALGFTQAAAQGGVTVLDGAFSGVEALVSIGGGVAPGIASAAGRAFFSREAEGVSLPPGYSQVSVFVEEMIKFAGEAAADFFRGRAQPASFLDRAKNALMDVKAATGVTSAASLILFIEQDDAWKGVGKVASLFVSALKTYESATAFLTLLSLVDDEEYSSQSHYFFDKVSFIKAGDAAKSVADFLNTLQTVNVVDPFTGAKMALTWATAQNYFDNLQVTQTTDINRLLRATEAAEVALLKATDDYLALIADAYAALPDGWYLDLDVDLPTLRAAALMTDPGTPTVVGETGVPTVFAAMPGDNVIVGRSDQDVVVFTGAREDYVVSKPDTVPTPDPRLPPLATSGALWSVLRAADGAFVIDGSARQEGVKTLRGIDFLVFADGQLVPVSDLAIFGGTVTLGDPPDPDATIGLLTPLRAGVPVTIVQRPGDLGDLGDLSLSWQFGRADGKTLLGEPVLAVAAGTVVFVETGVPDGDDPLAEVSPPAPGQARDPSLGPAGELGNVVTLRHEIDGVVFHSSYLHLAEGSTPLAVGDTVAAGALVGRVGLTGARSGAQARVVLGSDLGPYTHPGLGDFPAYQIAQGVAGDPIAGLLRFADAAAGGVRADVVSTTPFEGGGWIAAPGQPVPGGYQPGLKGPGDGSIWGTLGTGQAFPSFATFAALKADGSVVTWGNSLTGGDTSTLIDQLQGGVTAIYSNLAAFAALKADGSVVTWGLSWAGGDSSAVAEQLQGGVIAIYSTANAFAALKADGSVVTWGLNSQAGDSNAVADRLQDGVTAIYSNVGAFAALKSDGSVVTWGLLGGNSSAVADKLLSGVTKIFTGGYAFAALKADGSVVTWGSSDGGDSSAVADQLQSGVTAIYSTAQAFAALKANGSVVTWGHSWYGADSSAVADQLQGSVTAIFSTESAFAALKADGSVVTWGDSRYGGSSNAVADQLQGGVTAIYSTLRAFAALKADGSVVTWGESSSGGDSNAVADKLASGVVALASPFASQQQPPDGHDAPWTVTRQEGDGAVSFTVTRADAEEAEIVFVSTVQDQGFRNVQDYVGVLNLPLSFAPGETQQTVTVDLLPGAAGRPEKTFGLIVQASPTDPIAQALVGVAFTVPAADTALQDLVLNVQAGEVVRATPWISEMLGPVRFQYDSIEITALDDAGGGFRADGVPPGDTLILPASALGSLWFGAPADGITGRFAVTPLRGGEAVAVGSTLTVTSSDSPPAAGTTANLLIPQATPHVTPADVVASARAYVGLDWGATNCTGLVWAISWTAGTHYHDASFETIRAEPGKVFDGDYVVPHAWAPNQPGDGWAPAASGSGGGWAMQVRAGDAVRLYAVSRDTTANGEIDFEPSFVDGAVRAHSFVVTDVRLDAAGNGHIAIVDNGGDIAGGGIRRVAERRIEVRDGQAQADGYPSFMSNPEAYYIDRIDQEWFDTRFPGALSTSVIGPGHEDLALFRSAAEQNTLVIVAEQHRDTTHAITTRDGIGVVEHAGGTAVFTGYETVTFTGGPTNNTVILGPLALAGVSNATVFLDLVGGTNRVDARTLDRRLVVVGGDGDDRLMGGAGDDVFEAGLGRNVLSGGGGANTFVGSIEELDGGRILDFSAVDTIRVVETVPVGSLRVEQGSAVFRFDRQGLAEADAKLTLQGDFSDARFEVSGDGPDTVIRLAGENAVSLPGGGVRYTARGATGLRIAGGAGDDVITGTDGNDVITGGGGADLLIGGRGDDTLIAGGGDRLRGGPGRDRFVVDGALVTGPTTIVIDDFRSGEDVIVLGGFAGLADFGDLSLAVEAGSLFIGLGDDRHVVVSGIASTNMFGPSDVEIRPYAAHLGFVGLAEGFSITGADETIVFRGIEGIRLDTGGGNNRVLLGSGHDTITGGAGNDAILAGRGGNNRINLSAGGDNRVNAGDGADTIIGGAGRDVIRPGRGDDLVDLRAGGDNFVFNLRGDDTILGGAGDDVIFGGIGDTRILAGGGNNRIVAGPGRDTIGFVQEAHETRLLDFRPGSDTLDFTGHDGVSGLDDLTLRQIGTNTIIEDGSGGRVVLAGIDLDQIDGGIFLF